MGANSKRVLKTKTFRESMMKTVSKTKVRLNLTQQARRRVALTMLICLAFGDVSALPLGEQVQAGNVTFERGAQFLNINQASQKAIVNWQSFSIAANEAVRLNQPTQGVALFRVVGSDPSHIFGSLTATGSLFLSNPNGVLFGRSAQVDVGSLVATSMRINNDQFLAGRYQFNADLNGSVVNDGIIRTEDGGYIALLSSTVENNGLLQANNGSVVLGSAQSAILDVYGDGLVRVKLDGDALNAVVKQTGNITADGGAVQLATHARSAAINVDGVVQANSLVNRNGVIRLEGDKNAKVSVSGMLIAKGEMVGSKGGNIKVTGEQVALFKNAHLDASGDDGGGTVLVGGDLQGKNAQVYNARTTFVAQGATIDVSAKQNGNGGKAIVWADSATRYYGSILAKGGTDTGNGGFAEVSGKQYLDFIGKADLSAINGLAGNLLLDPLNITLTTVDANTTGFTPPGDITEAFADDAGLTSTFNVNAGGSFAGIAAGSTITLQATNNITVSTAFNVATATGSANNSLVLQANNNIAVNAAITTTGTGSITMQADADNSGAGSLELGANNLSSQAGGISLSGASITKTTGTIVSTGAAGTNGGNINITSTSTANLGSGAITTNGGAGAAATAGGNAGNVTISAAGAITTGAVTATGGAAGGGNAAGGNAGLINIFTTAGAITTGTLTARTGAATGTGAGGTVGSITVNNTAAAGNVTLGALNTSGGANGNAGNITANSTGLLTLNGAIAASGGANVTATTQAGKNAGNIILTGNNGITTAAVATINANGGAGLGPDQAGGNAGNVTISAAGAITTGAVTATGGAAGGGNAAGGNAGLINIFTTAGAITTGTLTARTGAATGTGAGGTVGSITVNNTAAAGNVTLGALNTSGGANGNAGNITANSTGLLTLNGAIAASGGANVTATTQAGKNAGNIILTGNNGITTAAVATINANGGAGLGPDQAGGNAGNVSLVSSADAISSRAINARTGAATGTGLGGLVGSITLNGESVTTNAGALTTTGNANGNGGNIAITSNTGNTSVGAIATNGGTANAGIAGRNAGSININSAGTVTSTSFAASGTNANGATFSLAGGNAAAVNITGGGGVNTTTIVASGGNASTTNANGGNAGTIALTNNTSGNISATTITARNGNAAGTGLGGAAGAINITNNSAVGNITTGNLSTQGGTLGQGGSIAVNGQNDVTVGTVITSGGTTLIGNAGRNAGTVTISAGGNVAAAIIASNGSAGLGPNQNGGTGGAVNLIAGTGNTITHSSINTSGGARTGTGTGGNGANVNVNGNSLLSANTTITATVGTGGVTSGTINFGGTINSSVANRTLAINTTAATTLNGAIGNTLALTSLTTNAGGTTAINGGVVTTTGAQSYGEATTLGAATTFTTTNSNVIFSNSVNASGNNVFISAGTGAVTATNASNNFGNLAISAGSANIRDTNAIALGATNVTGNYQLQTGGAITQTSGITVGGATTLNAGAANDITLNNAANNFNSVAVTTGRNVSLVDANTLTLNASNVTTISAQTLSNDLTLGGNVTATGAGNAIVLASAANFINSSNSSLTPGTGRWLVYSTNPLLDTRGAGLLTAYDFKQYNTAFGSTILGAGDGFIYTLAPTITPTLGGTATKTYDATTSASIGSLSLAHNGEIDGDIVILAPLSSATYDNINAGTGKNVSSNPLSIASATNGTKQVFGYTFATLAATAAVGTIEQRPITVTANPGQSKVFGAADPLPFTFTVAGLGLVGGDTLIGALNRTVGETVGNYAINQGSLLASPNYILSYVGNNFNILAPSTVGGGSGDPRNAAGLVDLNPSLSNYTNPQLFVLNVVATAAGVDSEGQAGCEQDPESLAKDQDFVLMLNYGLNLPKGLNTSCDKAKI